MEQASNLQQRSIEKTSSGWINGLIGVIIFSGSLPATRIAVLEFDAGLSDGGPSLHRRRRGVVRAAAVETETPRALTLLPLFIVAMGVVVGFPLLTALALQYVTSAHSIVFVGLLPLATAVFAVLRGGERPRPVFWVFSILGSTVVVGFAVSQGLTRLAGWRPVDAAGDPGVRPGLRRRCEAVARHWADGR